MKRVVVAFALLASSSAMADPLDDIFYHFQACVACMTVSMDDGVTGDKIIAQTAMNTCQAEMGIRALTSKGYPNAREMFYLAAWQAVQKARTTGYCPP